MVPSSKSFHLEITQYELNCGCNDQAIADTKEFDGDGKNEKDQEAEGIAYHMQKNIVGLHVMIMELRLLENLIQVKTQNGNKLAYFFWLRKMV